MSRSDIRPAWENEEERISATAESYLIGRIVRVLGDSPPPGYRDMLHVLTHPDVIELTKEYIAAREAYNGT